MRLPYLQVTQETWAKARMLAPLLGIHRREAFALICDLWSWGLDLTPDDQPPTGECHSPRATLLLAGALEWSGDPAELVGSLEDVGLLARLEPGLRVRGMDRYRKAWEQAKKERDRKARWKAEQRDAERDGKGTRKRRGTDAPGTRNSTRKTQTKTQTQTQKKTEMENHHQDAVAQSAPLAEVVVETVSVPDVTGIPSRREVEVIRWVPVAEGCWEAFQLIREQHGLDREATRPLRFDEWFVAAVSDAGPEAIERVYRGYLADESIRAKDHPTAVFIAGIWDARKPDPQSESAPEGEEAAP